MKIAKLRHLIVILPLFCSSLVNAGPNATALSKAMLPEAQFKQMIDAIVQTGMAAAKAKIETDKLKIDMTKKGKNLETSLRNQFTYDYFTKVNSTVMSKNFTEEELGKILAFYNTSVGKKWTKHTPEIVSETMMQIQLDLQEKLPKYVEALAAK